MPRGKVREKWAKEGRRREDEDRRGKDPSTQMIEKQNNGQYLTQVVRM